MKNLTTGHPLKLIFFFALPLMFGNLLQQLYIMVDTMIVGRFVGVDALASIGGADWINWAILGLLMGFTQGFSIRVSNCLGANDEKGMEKSIAMSYLSCFVIAILVIIFSQIIIEPLLKLLNTPSHTIQGSITYLRIMSGGALIVIFYNCCSSILRAIGDSRTPLIAMVIAACLNVILDLLFVCIFHQGIAGAAIAPNDSIFWEEFGGTAIEAATRMIPDKQMLEEAAAFAGTVPVKNIVPIWKKGTRYLYTGGSVPMRDAAIYVRENSWDDAYELWRQAFEGTKNQKKKMRAALNIAVYYEMKDSLAKAEEWAEKAQQLAKKIDKKNITDSPQATIDDVPNYYLTTLYLAELKERNAQLPKLKLQMSRFNDDF